MVLFFGSIIFYAMGAGRMAILLTALTIVNYILGQMVFSADKGGVKASNKRAFYLAILIDAGSLILFKVMSGLSRGFLLPLGSPIRRISSGERSQGVRTSWTRWSILPCSRR